MKYSSFSKRRSRGYTMDNVRLFAGSCIFIIVMGNVVMLQSYRSFVARQNTGDDASDTLNLVEFERARRSIHGLSPEEVIRQYAQEFLPHFITGDKTGTEVQYSVIEGRIRKLMQENSRDRLSKKHGRTSSWLNGLESVRERNDTDAHLFEREGMLTCMDVNRVQNMQFIGSGWTKTVYQGDLDGTPVAVKTVDINGHDVGQCLNQGFNITYCYNRAAKKIIKEIVLLQALAHDNIVKVLGFCVPDRPFDGGADTAVAMVTELGEPIDQIKLLQMSWEDRLKVSFDVTKLIEFLTRSAYGSLALNDFRRNQFVMVNGTLKLSDVDDAGFEEPRCNHHSDCSMKTAEPNVTKRLLCHTGHCKDHNEFLNIFKTRNQFTSFLLPHGAPKSLRPIIDKIVWGFNTLRMNAKDLLHEMDRVVSLYKSGAHLSRNNTKNNSLLYHPGYRLYKKSDLPGQYDYRCRFTISGGSCTLSVFDLQEAEEVCNFDEECQGFVWTHKKTWSGRTLVHFKNGKGSLSPNPITDYYLKPS